MKERKQYRTLGLLPGILLAAALWSCTHEELPAPAEENARIPLTVQVTDEGFATDAPSTRTMEEGYKTTFTEGDTIGIFTLQERSTVLYHNLPFVLTSENGKPVWKNPDGNLLWYDGTPSKYFAYYPYQQQVPQLLYDTYDPDLCLYNLIAQFSIPADQSTYEKYTAADLMVARGDFTPYSPHEITFTFVHRMTLLEIDARGLSNPSGMRFNNFMPYQPDPGVPFFRYILQQTRLSSLQGSVPFKDLSLFYTTSAGEVLDFEFTGIRDLSNRGKCIKYQLKE